MPSQQPVKCPNPACNFVGTRLPLHFRLSEGCKRYAAQQRSSRNVRARCDSSVDGSSIRIPLPDPPDNVVTEGSPPSPSANNHTTIDSVTDASVSHLVNTTVFVTHDAADEVSSDIEADTDFDATLNPNARVYNFSRRQQRPTIVNPPEIAQTGVMTFSVKVGEEEFPYKIGKSYPISNEESFSVVDSHRYGKHIPGMARILQKLRMSGCPLKVVDEVFILIEQQLKLGNFTPHSLPRSQSSLRSIFELFKVPSPIVVSVPLERTTQQRKADVLPKRRQFPVFDFQQQLQDLFDEDVFDNPDNLCINPGDPWSPFVPLPGDDMSELQCGQWFQNIVSKESPVMKPYHF